jgi:hypothetical protein
MSKVAPGNPGGLPLISDEERAFRVLVSLGGVANGRQLAKALGITGPHATHEVGQIMRNLVPGRVERLADSVYKVRGTPSLKH